jgi:hypothetical protein
MENGTTVTKTMKSDVDLRWDAKMVNTAQSLQVIYSTEFGPSEEQYSIMKLTVDSLTSEFDLFLNGSSHGYEFGDIMHSSIWEAGLVSDVLGLHPRSCEFKSDFTKGFAGWSKRIQSLSNSATNA